MSAEAEKPAPNAASWKRSGRDPVVQALLWFCFVGTLLLIFGPALLSHMQRAADPLILNEDARQQIYPFYRFSDSALFSRDYIGDYYLANLPLGYRGLYMMAGNFGLVVELSKIVPYLGLLITVTCLAMTAHAFGGKAGAWVAAALCLGSSVYLERMSGGLPLSFVSFARRGECRVDL